MANEIGEVNKMAPVFKEINQGTVAIESSRAITEAQGKLLLSNQIIEVLNEICNKFGLAID